MADNTTLNAGSGGDVVRTEDKAGAGVKTQVVLLDVGGVGTEALIGDGSNKLPVSGPLTDTELRATAVPVSASSLPLPTGAATAALQGGGLPAALGAGGGLKVDGSGTALPVSAASLPLPSGAATSALQGGGLPAALGAGGGLKVDGSGTALPVSAASLPLPSGAATSALQGGGLPAALGAGGGLKVDGSGTALPISAASLPLPSGAAAETGGNLAAAATSLAVLDDWDESDRAKVNPIVGQAGIAAGAGAVGATVPRVTHASDDPVTTAVQIMDDWDSSDDCRSIPQSAAVMDGTVRCTVKRFHSAAPADNATLIAAVASKKIRLRSLAVISISGTICRFWLDDEDGTAVLGNSTGIALEEDSGAAAPGFILPMNPDGWIQTPTANKALRIQFASGSGVVIFGTYIEVD